MTDNWGGALEDETYSATDDDQADSAAGQQPDDRALLGPQRRTDPHLPRPAGHRIADYPVESDPGEDQSQDGEAGQDPSAEFPTQ